MNDVAQELKTPWWLRPVYIFVCLNLIMAAIALSLDDETYAVWRTAKYFTIQEFGIVAVAAIAFILGNALGTVTRLPRVWPGFNLNFAFRASCLVAMVAYPIWFANAIANGLTPDMLVSFITGEAGISNDIKDTFVTIPGITTMTQFGVTSASLYPFLRQVHSMDRWMFRALFLLCLTRSILLSERLAIIEFGIPLLIAYVARWYTASPERKRIRIDFLGPPLLTFGLIGLFALGEYFRSWQFYQDDFSSFWQFILSRLSSYYVTALNNGALLSQHVGLLPFPYFSFLSLWMFPGLPERLKYSTMFNREPEVEFIEALQVYATDELNNGCGIFLTYVDFGMIGFIINWMLFAYVTKLLMRDYCRGSLVGQLFFPIFLIAVVESPRVLYVQNTRAFPAIVGAIAVLLVSRVRVREK